MPNSQANFSKLFFLCLFIAAMSQVARSEKYRAATYLVNWRATGKDVNLHDREGYAKLLMAQESTCTTANPDSNFSALFAEDSVPTKWKMDETHAEDKPFTDLEGRCRSRSKVTLAISQDNVAIHIHLNHLCSDEACADTNLSGQFSCSLMKAPEKADVFFSIGPLRHAKEHKCTRS